MIYVTWNVSVDNEIEIYLGIQIYPSIFGILQIPVGGTN
jgi:hypothetical protein